MAPCMFNYMTDLTLITENPGSAIEFTVRGHDCKALLFNYMDELLFRFCEFNIRVLVDMTADDVEIAPHLTHLPDPSPHATQARTACAPSECRC